MNTTHLHYEFDAASNPIGSWVKVIQKLCRYVESTSMRLNHAICISKRAVLLAVSFCSLTSAPVISQTQAPDKGHELQNQIEPSVAYLEFWPESGEGIQSSPVRGTGFVIADPLNQNWIVTTAHSLAPTKAGNRIVTVKYRLPNQKRFAMCKEVIVDEKHDLAVLRPHEQYPLNVPALKLYAEEQSIPTPLYALGSEWALKVALFEGKYVAEVITVEQWAKQLISNTDIFSPFAIDTTFVRHGIPIAQGYSGCPIVTSHGEVVGIQSSKLEAAPLVGIAVHHKHIRDFDWTQKSSSLADLDLSASSADRLLVRTSGRAISSGSERAPKANGLSLNPTTITLGGVQLEAPLIHHGYVERDALIVIDKYVQDKEYYFVEQYGGNRIRRLQQLLDRTRLALVSCPLLGVQMLVPEGFRYSAQSMTGPDGILITFSPPENRNVKKPYDWPVSIWVTVEPELFANAQQDFLERVDSGEFKLTPEEEKFPELFGVFRDRWTRATVADIVGPRFASRDLAITMKEQHSGDTTNANEERAPEVEKFKHAIAGEGSWLRNNYISTTRPFGHMVRIGTRDPLIMIAHFQYSTDDTSAFNQIDGVPDVTAHDFIILASSFSCQLK